MTTDSLIDLTLKALKGAYEILLYNFEAIPTSGETVTTNVRPVFNDICEAVARLEMSMDCGSCSEISVVERGTVQHLVKREIPRLLLALAELDDVEDNVEVSQELIMCLELALVQARGQLKALADATKPVSVSLAKCVDALQKVCFADTHGGFNHESQTKAVLDAAGVKYVD